jgi:hypothetical protein
VTRDRFGFIVRHGAQHPLDTSHAELLTDQRVYLEFAAEFVGLKVDVILTAGPNTAIAKQATSVIPIVSGKRVELLRELMSQMGPLCSLESKRDSRVNDFVHAALGLMSVFQCELDRSVTPVIESNVILPKRFS